MHMRQSTGKVACFCCMPLAPACTAQSPGSALSTPAAPVPRAASWSQIWPPRAGIPPQSTAALSWAAARSHTSGAAHHPLKGQLWVLWLCPRRWRRPCGAPAAGQPAGCAHAARGGTCAQVCGQDAAGQASPGVQALDGLPPAGEAAPAGTGKMVCLAELDGWGDMAWFGERCTRQALLCGGCRTQALWHCCPFHRT